MDTHVKCKCVKTLKSATATALLLPAVHLEPQSTKRSAAFEVIAMKFKKKEEKKENAQPFDLTLTKKSDLPHVKFSGTLLGTCPR